MLKITFKNKSVITSDETKEEAHDFIEKVISANTEWVTMQYKNQECSILKSEILMMEAY